MMLSPKQFDTSGHTRAIKNVMKQAREGKMSLSDAQANADWAQQQIDRARDK